MERVVRPAVLHGNTNIHYPNPVYTLQRPENSHSLQHDNGLMTDACRMFTVCAMASHKRSDEPAFVRNIRYFQRRLVPVCTRIPSDSVCEENVKHGRWRKWNKLSARMIDMLLNEEKGSMRGRPRLLNVEGSVRKRPRPVSSY